MLISTVLAGDPDVGEDPFHDEGVVIWDERETSPRDQVPDWNIDYRQPPPTEHVPDPFYCRPEAPFPNDDCITRPEPADPTEAPEREVRPGDVVEAIERVGLPRLQVAVQPAGSTLVNLETIFYTSATPFERSVDILDSTVDLRATPAGYTWHHGDGTTQTTSSPGRPYPALDIVHRYREPGRASARVDVTYRVTYRIDDGDWQQLDTTITATGPATTLRIREARPVLTR
ncbi:hypothetical protein IDH50_14955 [Aeromicrobium tamlense]|uniref:PKD domain-containing protein n=1 Tax=Aeromicrobium tamlense TaxID=375541 RepID=A0A8I0FYV4_9ACTN|nr:hypothetical protein [Aeromicrobium tamlense]MBD1270328.1 hypothetical protein [Aeromicrobium tamlense]MBD1271540.1 hypothetical protein [Aeromicrobium tamlense]NYI37714.1 hypothetical protein [Aeromicrobium tamlense]